MNPFKRRILMCTLSFSIVALTIFYCDHVVAKTMVQKELLHKCEYIIFNYAPILLLLAAFIAITNKLIFSALVTSGLAFISVTINTAKYDILRKPFIPSDLLLFRQVLDDFSLYLKYVNFNNSISAAAVLFAAILAYLLFKEKGFFKNNLFNTIARAAAAIFLIIFAIQIPHQDSTVQRIYSKSSMPFYTYNPELTVKMSGLFYNFIRMSSGINYTVPDDYGDPGIIKKKLASEGPSAGAIRVTSELPDILVVQSEAFYDLRKHVIEIDDKAYSDFDIAAKKSVIRGSLRTPTVGGNTVKTEFSFLTGISLAALPDGCDYPYRFLVRNDIWSIAQHLKSIGYKTVMIHPFSPTFWDRNIAMPLLGFDEFLDIKFFAGASKEGFYVSDKTVAEKVISMTEHISQPVFIFAVTMENHGPWDSKRVENQREFRIAGGLTNTDREQMGRYLHHVVNAGKMADALICNFRNKARPTLLAFYGDHSPGLDGLTTGRLKLREANDSISDTPYFIWRNYGRSKHITKNMDVSFLASTVLDEAGVNNDEYFRTNLYYRDISGGRFKDGNVNDQLKRSYSQLLYDNVLNGLGKKYHTTKLQSDDTSIDSTTVILNYGPKEVISNSGFNVQHDGSNSIWLVVSGSNKNLILFADGQPLETYQGGDEKSVTAIIPKYLTNESKRIKLFLKNTVNYKRSKEVYLLIK